MRKFKNSNRIIASILVLVIGIFTLSACGNQSNNNDKKINVSASTDFYGEVARDILGSHGTVNSIINSPNVDPHDFQATPQTAKETAKANVAIYNGLNYDSWMNKLLQNNSNSVKEFDVGKLMGKTNSDNPHVWYQSQAMPKLADSLAEQFGKQDPDHKNEYKENAKKYKESLQPMLNAMNDLKQSKGNKNIAVSEPVANYALEDMGFKINNDNFAKSIEQGTDPSPAELAKVQNDIKNHKISFFVYNTQATNRVVNNLVNLAKENDIPIVHVTETQPANKNYQQWMTSQYQQMLKALNGDEHLNHTHDYEKDLENSHNHSHSHNEDSHNHDHSEENSESSHNHDEHSHDDHNHSHDDHDHSH